MADEIGINLSVTISNGNLEDNIRPGQIQMDQTTARGGNPGSVTIGTTEEVIAFGDVTPGLIYVRNLDTTNFILVGPESGGALVDMIKVQPGKIALFELASSVTVRAKADTADCDAIIKGYAT